MSSLRCCKLWPDASIRQMWLIGTTHQTPCCQFNHLHRGRPGSVGTIAYVRCHLVASAEGVWKPAVSRHRTGGFGTSRRYTTSSVLWITVIDAARIVRGTGSVQQSGVRLSVPLIDSSNGGQQVCCWVPCWQEYRSIASGPLWASFCGRH